jgi:hypothetical protein
MFKVFNLKTVLLLIFIILIGTWLTTRMFNPTNIAETASDHAEAVLQTRRYGIKGDLKQMRLVVKGIIPNISTRIWGGKWRLAAPQAGDSTENLEIVRAEIPVVFFTDDLLIELKEVGNEVLVNARSNSRTGKSDFGENRRHLLQLLAALDKEFQPTK